MSYFISFFIDFMFWRKYIFKRNQNSFLVYNRDNVLIWSLSNDFNSLSQEERKFLKRRLWIPKILVILFFNTLTPIFFPFLALKYKNYLWFMLYMLSIISIIILFIADPIFDRDVFYEQNKVFLIISSLVMLLAELIFIINWTKISYNNKTYVLLKLLFEKEQNIE